MEKVNFNINKTTYITDRYILSTDRPLSNEEIELFTEPSVRLSHKSEFGTYFVVSTMSDFMKWHKIHINRVSIDFIKEFIESKEPSKYKKIEFHSVIGKWKK